MKNYLGASLLLLCLSVFAETDKYRLILNDDPSSTITIAWNQVSGSSATVHYDVIDYGADFLLYNNFKVVDRTTDFRGMNNHFARLNNLLPNTNYYFVIVDGTSVSERFWFKTAPADNSRLSFIAGGDSRNNILPRRRANELVGKLKPTAVLFGGDMTDDDTNAEWLTWMNDWQLTIADDGRMFPIVAARGNHESPDVIYNLFDTPTEDAYYAITFGENLMRAYTLNSEISVLGDQLDWLTNDLEQSSDIIWRTAQYHKPMRPHTADKSEGQSEYTAWAQLFFDHGVRLVIDCDSHMAKTTWPIEPSSEDGNDEGFIVNETYGTVYVGEGCWGAPLRPNDDDKSWTRDSGSFNQFKWFFVDEEKIELRTIKVDNADEVAELSNEDPFEIPENLDVWQASNGAIIEILPPPPIVRPEIAFAAGTPTVYLDGNNIVLPIDVLSEGNGISKIDFYLDDVFAQADLSAPYNFTQFFSNNQYRIKAIATDNDGFTGETEIIINVGQFELSVANPIISGDDDVEETEGGAIYTPSGDLEMAYDVFDYITDIPNAYQKIGLRFQNINIPAGAQISDAYIQFRSDETDSEPASFIISMEDTGNAAFIESSDYNISSRSRLATTVNWNPPAWTGINQTTEDQRINGLQNMLQQITERVDWSAGNSALFIIEATGESLTNPDSKRVADSYDAGETYAPTLHYTFSFDAANILPPVALQSIENKAHIRPNPFTDKVNIDLPFAMDNLTIEIVNLNGELMYTQKVKSAEKSIAIEPKIDASGVYLINILNAEQQLISSQKLVKQ